MIALAAVWALPLMPFLFPEARLWGVHHLIFLPRIWCWGYLVGGMVIALLVVLRNHRTITRPYNAIAAFFFEKTSYWRWAALAVAGIALFWMLRPELILLGDGPAVAANLGKKAPSFKWTESGAVLAARAISYLLPGEGIILGQRAYQTLSAIAGGFSLFLFCAIATVMGRKAGERFIIFPLLLFAGWGLLFCGYVENYPVLWPAILLYIFFALRYLDGHGKLWLAFVCFVLAAGIHLQSLFFIPSLLVLLFSKGKIGALARRHKRAAVFIGSVVAMGALIAATVLYSRSITIQLLLMPIFAGRPPDPSYTLLSWRHLFDIINQFLLLVPLLPMLFISGKSEDSRSRADQTKRFLIGGCVGGMLFVILIEPRLGMARDWDLFALAGLFPLILTLHEFRRRSLAPLYPALTVAAAILILPYLAVSLGQEPFLSRYKSLLELDLSRGRTGIKILQNIYRSGGDQITVDSLEQVLSRSFPAYALVPKAYQLANEGKVADAERLADSLIALDPYSAELYNLKGSILIGSRPLDAVDVLLQAYRLAGDDMRVLLNLATAYQAGHNLDKAAVFVARARAQYPDAPPVIQGVASLFMSTRRFDSAYYYARQMVERDPQNPDGYLAAGYSVLMLGDSIAARQYLNRALELPGSAIAKSTAGKLLQRMDGHAPGGE